MAKRSTGGKSKKAAAKRSAPVSTEARSYEHTESDAALRPDVGVQKQFRGKKPPKTYRYDSSLSPSLEWDEQPARAQGEALIADVLKATTLEEAKAAAEQLKAMSKPFLNWAGKAERQAFEVPTLPLFVHERLSTKAILETVKVHAKDKQIDFDLFGDPQRPIHEQLRAYEYRDEWVNRMILGDSLVVMNSLLEYEGMGGQVQMIYMDPPYGVKYGSNFQPFVRKKDVSEGDDEDLTREPEMVQAYRDTWELNVHSYLTYLRDRMETCHQLLTTTGSMFVQISDENFHLVKGVMDEVFGSENAVCTIPFRKKTMPLGAKRLEVVNDYLVWYARDRERMRYHKLYEPMNVEGDSHWNFVELPDSARRRMTKEEVNNHGLLPAGSIPIQLVSLYPAGVNRTGQFVFSYRGVKYDPRVEGRSWFTNPEGMKRLAEANRLEPYEDGETLRYVLKLTDSPYSTLTNLWSDTSAPRDKSYVVETSPKVIMRCMLMTTAPGDLVLDPTCGSGTAAYVSEQWGRRWITVDTSRVPLTLARQRLLTATFDWYELLDDGRGPAGGFRYAKSFNERGAPTGGIVPYTTKGSIAQDEPVSEIVIVNRPEQATTITRIASPFVVEATMPVPVDFDGDGIEDSGAAEEHGDFVDRMVEVLRRSPDLRFPGNRTVSLKQVRRPAKSLSLSAEAQVDGKPVAIVFGPENGAVSEKLVFNAGSEAFGKKFSHLFVIGFEIEPNARQLVEQGEASLGLPATYAQATPDLVMGDLLKTMRSSQVFSICGLPEIEVAKVKTPKGEAPKFQVTLKGLDTFDPATMDAEHTAGEMVPAWFLDTDYDATRCFRVCQAFFPRTGAWDNLRKALKAEYDESLWAHLGGTTSAPFEAGEQRQIAVKVIDERGNELLVVQKLTG